tara:strand:- start:14909 stop:15733 length:825 start_codon:yes stop_codon:yes gene_type:complete
MSILKIWKNTSALIEHSTDLHFTENKSEAELILSGSGAFDLNEFPNLKAIFRVGVGTENIPFDECKKRKILLEFPSKKNLDILYEETSNFTIGLIFRMIYPSHNISEQWIKFPRKTLNSQITLIIGTGNIGARVAKKLKNFMKVKTFDIAKNNEKDLKGLIEEADIISIHIPGIIENENFFDQEKFKLMKKDSILINTSRAMLVEEKYLYENLAKGKIRAAFDVFWEEPYRGRLVKFHPDPFFISPHIASTSNEFFLGCAEDLKKLIYKISNEK